MNTEFCYQQRYVLDKQYFNECFEQSVEPISVGRAYAKSIFFIFFGALLVLITEVNPYAAWFVFALGILEALSVYYKKPWWVARQLLSKAANNEVTLTIDEQGIKSHSFYQQTMISWSDISRLMQTELGWIIEHAGGKTYLSNRVLSSDAIAYISEHSPVEVINKA
ncbi:YcxB family protein [Thalassotalea sp. G2M2-11]|uniref:YcxB family protein n=1 Tax=Thalassotalea sp. G2M2-11 TaxID=2787627 RepID=UPI0019D17D8A|nr:YcxB family protein [Thalassotalea sp. G2M2-11]